MFPALLKEEFFHSNWKLYDT